MMEPQNINNINPGIIPNPTMPAPNPEPIPTAPVAPPVATPMPAQPAGQVQQQPATGTIPQPVGFVFGPQQGQNNNVQ